MSNPFAAAANTPAPTPTESTPAESTPTPTPTPTPTESAPAPAGGAFAGPNGATVDAASLFGAAPAASGARLKDDEGCFVVIRAIEYVADMPTANGPANAIKADWVPVDGPNAGEVREGSLIFGKVVVSSIKANLDRGVPFTIGVVAHGAAKPGKNAPLVLNAPNDEQAAKAVEVARYLGWVK
jgi:hypothetical protein